MLATVTAVQAAPPTPQAPARAALEALQRNASGALNIEWSSPSDAAPSFIVGNVAGAGAQPEEIARNFMAQYGAIYGVRDQAGELAVDSIQADENGGQHVRLKQVVNGVSVFGGQLFVHLAGSTITAVNGKFFPDLSLGVTPTLSEERALEIVRAALNDSDAARVNERSGLVVYVDGSQPYLAWKVDVIAQRTLGHWLYFIDAADGHVVHKLNQTDSAKSLSVYTMNNQAPPTRSLPGILWCSNVACASYPDSAAQGAYNNASKTYDYYQASFGRLSYNNLDAPLISSVHFYVNYNNAFWNGSQMVYGDGDLYAQAFDVVAHELTHGVTEYTSNLIYEHQPGALNESWSDVMAVFAGCSATTGVANCNWQMGDTLTGGFIRDLSDPPAKGDPDHMSNYLWMPIETDQGGVHSNSGIPNKAAYLLTAGGTFHSVAVTGLGYGKAEQIYYRAMSQFLTTYANFSAARGALYAACISLVGSYSISNSDCLQVLNAWAAVGVGIASLPPTAYRVFVPAVLTSGCAASNILSNGSFESGATGWVQSPSGIIQSGYTNGQWNGTVSGAWLAKMGGAVSRNDSLYQLINIPAGRSALKVSYRLHVTSSDTGGYYDFLYTSIQPPGSIANPEAWVSDNLDNGKNLTITLTYNELPYTNQQMRLYVRSSNDLSIATTFYIDQVNVEVTCTRYTLRSNDSTKPYELTVVSAEPAR
jgi:thermolysin